MSATDDYKLALNLLAKVGMNGDLIGEFGKAKAMQHQFQSMKEMNNTFAPPTTPQPSPTPVEPQIRSDQGVTTPEDQSGQNGLM
jgi:hypothetical protein